MWKSRGKVQGLIRLSPGSRCPIHTLSLTLLCSVLLHLQNTALLPGGKMPPWSPRFPWSFELITQTDHSIGPRSIPTGPSWLSWTSYWVKWDCMLQSHAHRWNGADDAPWLTPLPESPSVGNDIYECHPQRKSTTIHVHCTHFRK